MKSKHITTRRRSDSLVCGYFAKLVPRFLLVICLFFTIGTSIPIFAIASDGQTLVFCSEASPEGMDPGQAVTGTTFDVTNSIYNNLIRFKPGSTDIEPSLATSWKISKDHREYTMYLRKNVKWHATPRFTPTRDFNADDVIFTFKRALNLPTDWDIAHKYKTNKYDRIYPASFPYYSSMGVSKYIEKIVKIDDYTVKIFLKKIEAPFLQNLAMSFAAILSKEYADSLGGQLSEINLFPVGTGAFVLQQYQKDALVRFKRNENYWNKENIFLDHLIFSITPESSVRVQKMRRGECQIMSYPKPQAKKILAKDPNIKILTESGYNIGYISLNVRHKPLNSLKVRRALAMAVRRTEIVRDVYKGTGLLANNILPPTQWSFDERIRWPKYDVKKAKKLLKEAGYEKGFKLTLYITAAQRPYNPNAPLMAQMLQSDWEKIGVQVEIKSYEFGALIQQLQKGTQDVTLIGWNGDNGDPDDWLSPLLTCQASLHGSNFGHWCYKPFDTIVRIGRETISHKKRIKIYEHAQRVARKYIPIIPIANSITAVPVSKSVSGFKVNPLGRFLFSGVSIDEGSNR